LDLGAGSGCIGLTLLHNLPQARLVSLDLSEKALEVAQQNAVQIAVQERVQFLAGDAEKWEPEIAKDFDFIVANPPYIDRQDVHVEENVKKFEPDAALFAADKGLHCLKTWSARYVSHLVPGGAMAMEMGYDQGPAMKAHFDSLGVFKEVRVIKDLSGHDRVIYGVKHG
jgi:release factor glutamine methyltransferase